MPSFALGAALTSSLLAVSTGIRKSSHQANLTAEKVVARWEQVRFQGNVPLGRIPAGSAECQGKFYIFGGETDVDSDDPMVVNRYMNDIWMFTPSSTNDATGMWSQLSADGSPDAPSRRVKSSMVCYLGDLYIFGGYERTEEGGQEYVVKNDFWGFDINTREWELFSSNTEEDGGPPPLDGHTANEVKGEMVIFGGRNEELGDSDKAWCFNLNQNTWVMAAPPVHPSPRHFHVAVTIPRSAKMRVFGGVHKTNEDGIMWEFDVDTDKWTQVAGEIAPEYKSGRSGAWFQDKVFLYGGVKIGQNVAKYNPDLEFQNGGAWQKATVWQGRLPVGRTEASLFKMNGNLWVYGGYQGPNSPGDSNLPERVGDLWRLKTY